MELGPTEELFDDPANPYTHALLSAIPEPDPTSEKERITLRGTPPSPRDPPRGCPFSTRCPAKIRPEPYEGIDDAIWERLEVFREILRERSRADRSLSERARALLGMETRFSSIEEIDAEVFGDVSVPSEIRDHLDRVAALVREGEEAEARGYLFEEFASACDRDRPEHHGVSETNRVSLCHRHEPDHESPADFFEHRAGER